MKFISLVLLTAAWLPGQSYDIIIRNARVADGTGKRIFASEIAIERGKIARIGGLKGASARVLIDARGRVVAPGFIDVHTHSESGIVERPQAENFLRDGVTTIVTGNCGSSELDLKTWFDERKPGVNLASLIGHNSLRHKVMGDAQRQATPAELEAMKSIVDQAMRDGAVGFSTGLEYVPGTYAEPEEVIELAKVAAKYGGIYATHMRGEGEMISRYLDESIRVGREAHIRVEVSHLKQDTRSHWGEAPQMLAQLAKARKSGVDIRADQYPYDAFSTGLSFLLPSWAQADGREAMKRRLADAATRAKLSAEMLETLRVIGQPDYSYVRLASFSARREWEGKTISEVNVLMGRKPSSAEEAQTILDLAAMGGGSGVYRAMGEQDILRIMKDPNVAVASDGGVPEFGQGMPHPRSYGTNARVLKMGVLPLPQLIRKMTSLPAATFGFKDRGVIRAGMRADLVLFDPAKVRDLATYERPHQYSEGFDTVIVNGRIAIDEGRMTGELAGEVLRRQ
jgi:N-acyl-D-amino-acid deacylase